MMHRLELRILCILIALSFGSFAKITPGVIIGSGRIGSHLFESNGKIDTLLRRSDPFPSTLTSDFPIYVCTRNDDLEEVILKTPKELQKNLIFLQNGILQDLLQKYGLDENTQGLIYYGISKKGNLPIDGKTSLNPEGLTAVTGKWSEDFTLRLSQAGLTCKVLPKEVWRQSMVQ